MPDKLSEQELQSALGGLTNWTHDKKRGAIKRQFTFKNFVEAFAFMTACALEAEKMNHHPEWSNVYRTVDVVLTTHSADGLTQLDIDLAHKMEALA